MIHAGNCFTGNVLCDKAEEGDEIRDLRGDISQVDCTSCLNYILSVNHEALNEKNPEPIQGTREAKGIS